MKELWITKDECSQYYDTKPLKDILDNPRTYETLINISDDEFKDFERVKEEYEIWQAKLKDLVYNTDTIRKSNENV